MDIFDAYIQKNKRNDKCRALTCQSYGKVYQKQFHKNLEPIRTNVELATYGDALIKFALCSLFLDKVSQLSVYKQDYEKDKFLIEVIAKKYGLLNYMNFDRDDQNIPKKYVFYEDKKNNKDKKNDNKNNPTKYIATTVEAVVGAIYQESRDFDGICKLIESWCNLE